MKKIFAFLAALLAAPVAYAAIGSGPGGQFLASPLNVSSGTVQSVNVTTITFHDGTKQTTAAVSGGGASALQVKVNGVQISSPTAAILFDANFTGSQSPTGTSNISLSPGSTLYIQNTGSPTPNATSYTLNVGSGTFAGPLYVRSGRYVATLLPSTTVPFQLTNSSSETVIIQIQGSGVNRWRIGSDVKALNSREFDIFNEATNQNSISISTNDVATFAGSINGNTLTASKPVKTDASKNLVSGLIDATTDITGVIPAGNLPTNIDYTNQAQTISGSKTFSSSQAFTNTVNVSSTFTLNNQAYQVEAATPTVISLKMWDTTNKVWISTPAITDAAQLGSTQTFTGANIHTGSTTFNGPVLANGSIGTAGYVLQTNGANAAPTWVASTASTASVILNNSGYQSGATYNIDGGTITGTLNLGTATFSGGSVINGSIGSVDGTLQFDASYSSGSGGSASSLTWAHTTSTNSNRLLLVSANWNNNGSKTVSSVTYGGVSLTLSTDTSASSQLGEGVYYLVNPGTGTQNIVITMSASCPGVGGISNSFYNVNQSTPLGTGAVHENVGSFVSSLYSTATSNTGELVIDFLNKQNTATGDPTAGASQTSLKNISYSAAGNGGYITSSSKAGSASVPMSWSWTGSERALLIAQPIKPASGSGVEATLALKSPNGTSQIIVTNTSTTVNNLLVVSASGIKWPNGTIQVSSPSSSGGSGGYALEPATVTPNLALGVLASTITVTSTGTFTGIVVSTISADGTLTVGPSAGAQLQFNSRESGNTPILHINKNVAGTDAGQLSFETMGSQKSYFKAVTNGWDIGVSTGNSATPTTRLFLSNQAANSAQMQFNSLFNGFQLDRSSITYFATTNNPVLDWATDGQLRVRNSSFTVDGPASIGSAMNMNSHLINNVTDPVSNQDAATKSYVDTIANGLNWKASAMFATNAALATNVYANGASGVGATLTGFAFGALTIDGYTPTIGQRILVKNEATTANNGIYTVTAVGSGAAFYVLTRATDFDQSAEIGAGDAVFIDSGTVNNDSAWAMTTNGTITVGTTAIVWSQFGATYSAGTGLSLSGTQFSLNTGSTNTWTAPQIFTSTTDVADGLLYGTSIKTANYTATSTDTVILSSGGLNTALTVTLPSITGNDRQVLTIEKVDRSTQPLTIAAAGTNTIASTATFKVWAPYSPVLLQANSTLNTWIPLHPLPTVDSVSGILADRNSGTVGVASTTYVRAFTVYNTQYELGCQFSVQTASNTELCDCGVLDSNGNRIGSAGLTIGKLSSTGTKQLLYTAPVLEIPGVYYRIFTKTGAVANITADGGSGSIGTTSFAATSPFSASYTLSSGAVDNNMWVINGVINGGATK